MNWDKFKPQFHESWHEKIRPFIESEECDKIYAFLKSESRRGKKIAPLSMNTFRCFYETSLEDLKAVLMGFCPYHTFINGNPVADGLVMGCTVTGKLQPSLENFYDGLEVELYDGLNLNIIKHADVSYLAKQGVLMLNASLTTEMNKAGNHLHIWEPFIKYLYENVINETNVPTIYLGKEAAKMKKYAAPLTWQFELSHPAAASYKGIQWETQGVFTKVNRIVYENCQDVILWLDLDVPF